MADTSSGRLETISIVLAVLLAVLTPLAGFGGVWFGGTQQRQAQVADLRQRTYIDFLTVAEDAFFAPPDSAEDRRVSGALAAVTIVGGPDVRSRADEVARFASSGDNDRYRQARESFVAAAQREYEAGR